MNARRESTDGDVTDLRMTTWLCLFSLVILYHVCQDSYQITEQESKFSRWLRCENACADCRLHYCIFRLAFLDHLKKPDSCWSDSSHFIINAQQNSNTATMRVHSYFYLLVRICVMNWYLYLDFLLLLGSHCNIWNTYPKWQWCNVKWVFPISCKSAGPIDVVYNQEYQW
jgi:hypothetical protein